MRNVWIVCLAEIKRRVTSRVFQFGVVIGMLGVALMIRLPGFVESHVNESSSSVILAGSPALTVRAQTLLTPEFRVVATRTGVQAPSSHDLDAAKAGRMIALERGPSGLHVTVYYHTTQTSGTDRIAHLLEPLNLELAAHVSPAESAKLLDVPVDAHGIGSDFATPASATFARGIAFGLLLVLYLIIILNSQLTLNSVIEEKTNRIAELLVAAIEPLALLYGKICAGMVLAAIQMVAWLVAALVASSFGGGGNEAAAAASSPLTPALLGDAIKPLAIPGFFFLLFVGLLQYSTIYAAIGSLVSRPEDLGSLSSLLIVPIVLAFITATAALESPNAPFVVAASFVPLIAPFVMFVRVVLSNPPLWQFLACAAINLCFLALVAIAAGRLYRVGMLLYGRPPSLRQIWNTVRG